MKRLLPVLALSLLLAGCSTPVTLQVQLNALPTRHQELKEAVMRVVEGRLAARKKTVSKQELTESGSKLTLTAQVSDAEGAKFLVDSLMTPFSMEIMKQVETGQGDIISNTHGEFKETGITTKHFDWATAGSFGDKGNAVIEFTPDGQELLKKVFSQNRGGVIGIFVRGQLMSVKTVDKSDEQTSISIDNITTPGIARSFVDDVNVGLHVMFKPVEQAK